VLTITKVLIRSTLTILPFIYMWLIWLQSSHFNPESLYEFSYRIDERILLMIGMILEFGHLFEFGILYFLLIIMILSNGNLNRQKEFFCFIIAAIYGLIDEIHQIYVPYRSFSLLDLLKNIIGVIVIWYLIYRSYFVKRNSTFRIKLKQFKTFINL
jgi:polysaccharide biosynthesis protein VpsQ